MTDDPLTIAGKTSRSRLIAGTGKHRSMEEMRDATMRAARYHGPGRPLALEDISVPSPGPGEALVRVRAAGVCHTELHFLSGLLDLGVAPITLGHEMAGDVEALGEGVSDVRPGDRVLIYYYVGCGSCEWCRKGLENLCDSIVAEYGFINDGAFAEYVRVPVRNLVPLPESLSYGDAATLGCSATTAVHAARGITRVGPGETVVVYGAGGVGFALIQLCKHLGARVIAVGRNEAKLKLARDLGADAAVIATGTDVTAEVLGLTDGRGADVIFELVGAAETMANSMNMLAKRGRLVFIGYSEDPFTTVTVLLVIKEAVVTASVGNTLDELREAVDLAGRGVIKAVVDREYPLEQANEALEDLKAGRIIGRAVLKP